MINAGTGSTIALAIADDQSSVTSSQVFEAGTYFVTSTAKVGATTYTGAGGVQIISSADITVSMTLTS